MWPETHLQTIGEIRLQARRQLAAVVSQAEHEAVVAEDDAEMERLQSNIGALTLPAVARQLALTAPPACEAYWRVTHAGGTFSDAGITLVYALSLNLLTGNNQQCAAGMLHVRIAELSAEREAAAVADAQKQRLLHELEAEAQRVSLLALPVLPSIDGFDNFHTALTSEQASPGSDIYVIPRHPQVVARYDIKPQIDGLTWSRAVAVR